MLPFDGGIKPIIISTNEDLPIPEFPVIATNEFLLISIFRFSKIFFFSILHSTSSKSILLKLTLEEPKLKVSFLYKKEKSLSIDWSTVKRQLSGLNFVGMTSIGKKPVCYKYKDN